MFFILLHRILDYVRLFFLNSLDDDNYILMQ